MSKESKELEIGLYIAGADGDSIFVTIEEARRIQETLNALFPVTYSWTEGGSLAPDWSGPQKVTCNVGGCVCKT